MPHPNENLRNISHSYTKDAEGFVRHVDHSSPPNDIPRAGVCGAPMNADPHGRGPKQNVYMPSDRTPLRGAPQEMRPPHTASPHRYAPETERESVVITPRSRP